MVYKFKKVIKDYKAIKDYKDLVIVTGKQVFRVYKVLKVLKDYKAIKDYKDLVIVKIKGCKVFKASACPCFCC